MEPNHEPNTPQTAPLDSVEMFCVVGGCSSNGVNTENVSFHPFPQTPVVFQLWLAALGISEPPYSSRAAVCSMHFREDDYIKEEYALYESRVALKPDAVPSIFSLRNRLRKEQEGQTTSPKEEDDVVLSRPRDLGSLGKITAEFTKLLQSSSDGVVDLNEAAMKLNIRKRRIYDITNALEGINVIKKTSKNVVTWMGWPPAFMEDSLKLLDHKEKRLDDLLRVTKRQIKELYEAILYTRFAYLTYEDIQSLPMFEDQAILVIKAASETKLEVAHPKECYQIHVKSETRPVEVLVCTDILDVSPNQRLRPTFDDGDYSRVPLRRLSTVPVPSTDNAYHNNVNATSNSPSAPSQHIMQPTSPKPSSSIPLVEPQLNYSPPCPLTTISIKEETISVDITPDEPLNAPVERLEQPNTDIHMADV
ncbi:unnamed protein product [Knipowitschia caucasica]